MRHALVVDDDADAAEMLAMLIADEGCSVSCAGSLRDARRQLAMRKPDVVFLDLRLPDGNGFRLFDEPLLGEDTEIVMMTGDGDLESSVRALRLGVLDYLLKPVQPAQLSEALEKVKRAAVKQLQGNRPVGGGQHAPTLLGQSPAMKRVLDQIERVALTGVTVLVTGESGTGKELVAATVHDRSRRRDKPLLAVNCGAISPHLMESEIFGHEKGSFTGADTQHIGFFERASGGTLFLDEITEMPPELQVKLLRVLESGTFMRVGSTQVQTTDVRLVAATNRDPEQAVRDGKLREDLLYRLNVFPIHMPPLRERPEDIGLIAQHFLDGISRREGVAKRFSAKALDAMSHYVWPGNVRELRNVVERSYVMAGGPVVEEACLPTPEALPQAARSDDPDAPMIALCVGDSWASIERHVVTATLRHYNGHQQRASHALGVSVKTVYNRLREWSEAAQAVRAQAGPTDTRYLAGP
jgi:two-component system response regulator AtoC